MRKKGHRVNKESGAPNSASPGRRSDRAANGLARGNAPDFALLREKRRLAVCNPKNGVRFTISLRDWEELLWAVRVYPEPPWRQRNNPHTNAHRIMARATIEDWLTRLQLD